jgi:hypothetical protein
MYQHYISDSGNVCASRRFRSKLRRRQPNDLLHELFDEINNNYYVNAECPYGNC